MKLKLPKMPAIGKKKSMAEPVEKKTATESVEKKLKKNFLPALSLPGSQKKNGRVPGPDFKNLRAVRLNGKNFLLGLSWRIVPQYDEDNSKKKSMKPAAVRKELKEKNETFQAFCIEKPTLSSSMLNLGTSSWYAPNFYALVPVVAAERSLFSKTNEELGTTVYGFVIHVFELSDAADEPFFWCVYINETGQLNDLSDRCLPKDEETLELFLTQTRDFLSGFDENGIGVDIRRHDPAESEDIINRCVAEWFGNVRASARLHQLEQNFKPLIFAGVGLAALALAGWYGYGWWEEKQRQEQERLFQQQNSLYAQQRIAQEQAKNFPRVWEKQPKVSEIYPAVARTLTMIPERYNNWTLKQAIWSRGGLVAEAEYLRRPSDIYMPLPNDNGKEPELNQKSGRARFRVFDALPANRGKEQLVREAVVKKYLTGIILGRPWKSKAAVKPPETKRISIRQGKSQISVTIEAGYRTATLTLEGLPFLSADLWKFFDFPGFVLDRIVKSQKGYAITGTIYLKK